MDFKTDEMIEMLDEVSELSERELEAVAGGVFDVTVPVIVQINLAVLSGYPVQVNSAGAVVG